MIGSRAVPCGTLVDQVGRDGGANARLELALAAGRGRARRGCGARRRGPRPGCRPATISDPLTKYSSTSSVGSRRPSSRGSTRRDRGRGSGVDGRGELGRRLRREVVVDVVDVWSSAASSSGWISSTVSVLPMPQPAREHDTARPSAANLIRRTPRRVAAGQPDDEPGAAAGAVLDPDLAAEDVGVLRDEGEPEAGPDAVQGLAATGEAFEDPGPLGRRRRPVRRPRRRRRRTGPGAGSIEILIGPPAWCRALSSRLPRIRSNRTRSMETVTGAAGSTSIGHALEAEAPGDPRHSSASSAGSAWTSATPASSG